jgi:hypothetical protein
MIATRSVVDYTIAAASRAIQGSDYDHGCSDFRTKAGAEGDELEVDLQPLQGLWTEEQYLRLTDHTSHLIEFADGVIKVSRWM